MKSRPFQVARWTGQGPVHRAQAVWTVHSDRSPQTPQTAHPRPCTQTLRVAQSSSAGWLPESIPGCFRFCEPCCCSGWPGHSVVEQGSRCRFLRCSPLHVSLSFFFFFFFPVVILNWSLLAAHSLQLFPRVANLHLQSPVFVVVVVQRHRRRWRGTLFSFSVLLCIFFVPSSRSSSLLPLLFPSVDASTDPTSLALALADMDDPCIKRSKFRGTLEAPLAAAARSW
mmetsp:Transcript_40241/g.86363  ORF Transcript_40241/g.86363 Transcript_40241/m.86363 type:complete len:226 (-) Transcript_40241:38-715(-)